MRQLSSRSLILCTLALALGGSALDAYLNLGDNFLGEICDSSDVDVLHFDALAGSGTRIHVRATGAETLHPRVVLTDLTSSQVLADVSSTGPRALISMKQLPNTGRYEIRISSTDGTVGTYDAGTVGRTAPDKLNFVDTQSIDAGEQVCVEFAALAGFELSAGMSPAGSAVRFANPVLLGPDGPILLTGFPDLVRVNQLPLGITTLTTFTLKADNIGGNGTVKTHVRLKETLDDATVVEDDDCN